MVHRLSTCALGLQSARAQAWLLCSLWNLSSLTRDRMCIPCIARQSLKHWTIREVPKDVF